MSKEIIAGFQLVEQQPSRRDRVEHWKAVSVRDHRTNADIYFLSDALMNRAQHLPQWGPFASFELRRDGTNNIFIVPNCLNESIIDVSNRLGGGVGLCLTWHAVNALSRLHNQGGSHGLIHPNSIGIDDAGRLSIRPALSEFIPSDPDDHAPSQATDCWQLGSLFDAMGFSADWDERIELLMLGIRREHHRLRLQPAAAVRQVLTTIIARHTDWEEEMLLRLGDGWRLDPAPGADEVVNYSSKPAPRIPRAEQSWEIDIWGNRFQSSSRRQQTFAQSVLSDSIFGGAGDNLVLPVPDDLEMADPFSAELEAQGKVQVDLDAFAPVRVELSAGNVSDETLRFSIAQTDEESDEVSSEADSESDTARPFALNLEPETVAVESQKEAAPALSEPTSPSPVSIQNSEQVDATEQLFSDRSSETEAQVSSASSAESAAFTEEESSDEGDAQIDFVEEDSEESEFEDKTAGAALQFNFAPGQRAWEHSSSDVSEDETARPLVSEATVSAPQIAARGLPKITVLAEPKIDNEEDSDSLSDISESPEISISKKALTLSTSSEALTLSVISEEDEFEQTIVSTKLEENEATVVDVLPVEVSEGQETLLAQHEAEPERNAVVPESAVDEPESGSQEPVLLSHTRPEPALSKSEDLAQAMTQLSREEPLDVEEPLADVTFPTVESVRRDGLEELGVSFESPAKLLNLFEESSEDAAVDPGLGLIESAEELSQAQEGSELAPKKVLENNINSASKDSDDSTLFPQAVVAWSEEESDSEGPKWTGAAGIMEDEESELGDEKWSFVGDVDEASGFQTAKLDLLMEEGEVKRSDFHQLEDKGSPYGLLIVVAVLAIFVVIGLVWDPQPLNPANPVPPQPPVESIRIEVNSQPQGASLLIDGRRFEQAPAVLSVSAEKSELVICAQWPAQESFTAPVHCRKVPVSLLEQGPYVFAAEQK